MNGAEVLGFLSNLGFVLLDLAGISSDVQFRIRFLETLIVDKVGFDVLIETLIPEGLRVVSRRLAIVLHQICRNVNGVRLAHPEVSFGQTQFLGSNRFSVKFAIILKLFVHSQGICLVKQFKLILSDLTGQNAAASDSALKLVQRFLQQLAVLLSGLLEVGTVDTLVAGFGLSVVPVTF
jgi:hypothetical protein